MPGSSYASILKDHKYSKLYAKRCDSLLVASIDSIILMPKDVKSIKVIAYAKQDDDCLITSTILLHFVRTVYNVTFRFMSFSLHKKIESDDAKFKSKIAAMLNEQMDIEEALSDMSFSLLR